MGFPHSLESLCMRSAWTAARVFLAASALLVAMGGSALAMPTPVSIGDTIVGDIATPGGEDLYEFTASPGQRVFASRIASNNPNRLNWSIEDSFGRTIINNTTSLTSMGPVALMGGVYTLSIRAESVTDTGDYTVELVEPADFAGPVAIGVPVVGDIATPGQIDTYTLSLPAAQSILVEQLSASTQNSINLEVFDSFGNVIQSKTTSFVTSGPYPLPAGDATIRILSEAGKLSNYSFQILTATEAEITAPVDTDILTTISPGEIETVNIDVPATGKYALELLDTSAASQIFNWRMFSPTGFELFGWTNNLDDRDAISLSAGTHILQLRGEGAATGDIEWRLHHAVDTTVPLSYNTVATALVDVPGQERNYTFAAAAGDVIAIEEISSTNINGLNWIIVDERGREALSRTNSVTTVSGVQLAEGNYTLTVTGEVEATGEVEFQLVPQIVNNSTVALGGTVTDTIDTVGEQFRYSLTVSPSQIIDIDFVTTTNVSGLNVQVTDNSGRVIVARTTSLQDQSDLELVGGTYEIAVLPETNATGTYTMEIIADGTSAFTPTGTPLAFGTVVDDVLPPGGGPTNYTFTVPVPNTVYLDLLAGNNALDWTLRDPAGRAIFDGVRASNVSTEDRGPYVLEPGTYELSLDDPNGNELAYSFRVLQVIDPLPQIVALGDTVSGELLTPGGTHRVDFTLTDTTDVFLDLVTGDIGLNWWLEDAFGTRFFGPSRMYFDTTDSRGPYRLAPGTYRVFVNGDNDTTAPYEFVISEAFHTTETLAIGELVSGSLDEPGSTLTYEITVDTDAPRVALDLIEGDVRLDFELFDPVGQSVFGKVRAFQADDDDRGPIRLTPGTWTLEMDTEQDYTADWTLQLIESPESTATLALGEKAEHDFTVALERRTWSLTLTEPTQVYFDMQNYTNGPILSARHVETGWIAIPDREINSNVDDQGPYWFPAGTIEIDVVYEGGSNSLLGFTVNEVVDVDAGPITINTLYEMQVPMPGALVTYTLEPENDGDELFFNVMDGTSGARWTLFDPVGTPVFGPLQANSWSSHDRGPFALASGTYTLVFDADLDQLSNTFFKVEGPIEPFAPNEGCASCGSLDMVFLFDTSSSMTAEAEDVCELAGDLVAELENQGVPVNPEFWALFNLSLIPCVEATVAEELGTVVPGSPPIELSELGLCSGGGNDTEDWALATAVVAENYPWTEGAVRLVVPVSDEGPYCGDGLNELDSDAVAYAADIANANNVVVSPIIPDNVVDPLLAISEIFAIATEGTLTAASFAPEELLGTVTTVAETACETEADAVVPQIDTLSPAPGSTLPAGVPLVIGGHATPVNSIRPIVDVQINGASVDALDGAGSFFATVTLAPGPNEMTLTLFEDCGAFDTSFLLYGSGGAFNDVDSFAEVTPLVDASFSDTTFQRAGERLLTRVQGINNGGAFSGPLLMAVGTNLDPSVTPFGAAGTLDTGESYFVVVPEGETVEAGVATASTDIAFDNPDRVKVDFDVRWLAPSNGAPFFTTIPETGVTLGDAYAYPVAASDPNGQMVTISLVQGPPGMTLDASGVSWTPAPDQLGTFGVTVRASDGTGGLATQIFTLTVSEEGPNQPPLFATSPTTSVPEGGNYQYDADATDADGDTLTFSLPVAPAGMTISSSTGVVSWPNAVLGNHTVQVVVSDSNGGTADQTFTLTVGDPTGDVGAPFITTAPVLFAAVDTIYEYAAAATDPDDGPLLWSLSQGPAGLTVVPTSGLVEFVPTAAQLGTHTVTLVVTDSGSSMASQTWVLEVVGELPNQPPFFVSAPPTVAVGGITYSYSAEVIDPEFEMVTIEKIVGPDAMSVTGSGLVTWVPPSNQNGSVPIVLRATDPDGATAEQAYTIQLKSVNLPPAISGDPPLTVLIGETYATVLDVSDPDGDDYVLSFDDAPLGMTIDSATGLLWWPSGGATAGSISVTIRATDELGAFSLFSFVIDAQEDTEAPVVDVFVQATPTCAGENASICVVASDNVGLQSRTLTVAGTEVPLSGECGLWFPGAPGSAQAIGEAVDVFGNATTETLDFVVADCTDETAPTVELIAPGLADVLFGPTEIVANISDDNPAQLTWTVRIAPADTDAFQVISTGSGEVIADTVGLIDTTALPNGTYRVQIEASDGLQTGGIEFLAAVSGDYKVGHYKYTVNDITVNLAGIPLSVSREYDSLRAGVEGTDPGDFGPGWRLILSGSVRDSAEDPPETGIGLVDLLGGEAFGLATRVYVTKPNGQTVGFQFAPTGQGGPVPFLYTPAFEADPGVFDELEVVDGPTTISAFGSTFYDFVIPYNPQTYRLTTKEGVVYIIDEKEGLLQVIDANGNTLDVTPDGIISSMGPSLVFTRDAEGRIEEIFEPAPDVGSPGSFQYDYDANGNLSEVRNQESEPTTYEYTAAGLPHHLTAIVDALGRPLSRNVYAADGRLIANCGAEGNVDTLEGCITYDFDPAGGISTYFDARGFRSELFFDERGNVVAERNYSTAVDFTETTRTFDGDDNLLSETGPTGKTWVYTYDDRGNRLSATSPTMAMWTWEYNDGCQEVIFKCDPLSNCTQYIYDSSCNIRYVIDGESNTTEYQYDELGRQTSIIDAEGQVWTFDFNGAGFVETITDPLGLQTTYTYDSVGNILTQTDRAGRTTTFTFDDANRVLTETWDTVPPRVTTWTYNAAGQVVSTTEPNSTINVSYYPSGLVQTVDNVGSAGAPTLSTTYAYDGNGNTTSVVDSLGGTPTDTYDDLDQLERAEVSGAGVTEARVDLTVNPAGLPLTLSRFGDLAGTVAGPSTTFTYDCDSCPQRLTGILHDAPGGSPIHHLTYTRDAALRITSEVDSQGSHGYGYDGADRLISVDRDAASLQPDETYSYDGVGNAISSHLSPSALYSYSLGLGGHQLSFDSAGLYNYSATGSLETFTNTLNGQTTTYEYDHRERLVGVTITAPGGGVVSEATYEYAANGWRTKAVVDGETRWFWYDIDNPILSVDSGGAAEVRRFYSRSVDRPFAEQTSSGLRWLLLDQVGTVRDAVATDGTVLDSYVYNAYGLQLSGTAPSLDDALRFTSREFDVPGGLGHFRARTYDTRLGRFLTEDPVEPWVYHYANDNPLFFVDPTGETAAITYALLVCDIVGAFSFGKSAGEAIEIGLNGAADALNGKAVDGEAVAKAFLEALYGVATGPILPCGLPFPGP